ncbi:hypothetical protein NFJ02_40g105340 [Pycnococcus provasolii]
MAANTDTAPRTPTHAQLLDMAIEHEQGRLPENDLKSGKYSWAKTTVRTLKRWARKLRLIVEQRREERRQELRHKNTPRSVAAADEIVVSVEDEHPTTVELRDTSSVATNSNFATNEADQATWRRLAAPPARACAEQIDRCARLSSWLTMSPQPPGASAVVPADDECDDNLTRYTAVLVYTGIYVYGPMKSTHWATTSEKPRLYAT